MRLRPRSVDDCHSFASLALLYIDFRFRSDDSGVPKMSAWRPSLEVTLDFALVGDSSVAGYRQV